MNERMNTMSANKDNSSQNKRNAFELGASSFHDLAQKRRSLYGFGNDGISKLDDSLCGDDEKNNHQIEEDDNCESEKLMAKSTTLSSQKRITRNQKNNNNVEKSSTRRSSRLRSNNRATVAESNCKNMKQNISLVSWEDRFEELVTFKEKHGHCLVPTKSLGLGSWCHNQRQNYKKFKNNQKQSGENNSSKINAEKIAALNKIGFVWDCQKSSWDLRYEELREYHQKHGHCNINTETSVLGEWVQNQRSRIGMLTNYTYESDKKQISDRISALNELNFTWQPKKSVWEIRFDELKQYVKDNGHCRIPKRQGSLGTFVQNQRREYRMYMNSKPSSINPDRIEKLNSIGFVWEARK